MSIFIMVVFAIFFLLVPSLLLALLMAQISTKFKKESVVYIDRDIRAYYKLNSGCHIVIVEQYDGRRGGKWEIVTNLCVNDATTAQALAESISKIGKVKDVS